MIPDIPSVADLKQAAESGQRITSSDVSAISHAESQLTGRGPLRGGPAAFAQSLAMRQMNFDSKLDEISRKPPHTITHEDAREMQAIETRAFNKPPGLGSVSAQVRSIADRNEVLGLPVAVNFSSIVSKAEAVEVQTESVLYGPGVAVQPQIRGNELTE
ncbi:hypothetical protein N7495_004852 [Penicillium taxi]|uniref:uncharacterized protein n=1 Tax=Penicillium taxi TaxID=168475 RepID=UPI002544FF4A|nr:uncharacterized protein N7495_004852 [Penicillium taxi]KAJ5900108.1 hypothetical protein N7495_004852 [Penicillium taxi]